MSKAEELLYGVELAYDYDTGHIIIDENRNIIVPESLKRLAVQHDHNSRTVTFDCPRYCDEKDMSKMSVYINYLRSDKEIGCYKATNVVVDEDDENIIHFNWTISKNVAAIFGEIVFNVCIRDTDADGEEITHWNSELCTDCVISQGLEYDGTILQEVYYDIVESYLKAAIETGFRGESYILTEEDRQEIANIVTKEIPHYINYDGIDVSKVNISSKYTWAKVFQSIDDGTYSTKYEVGDTLPLDLGEHGIVNMQIAAFDKDDIIYGYGKAPITWVAKELLNNNHVLNPSLVTNMAWTEYDDNCWMACNQDMKNTDATATWTIKPSAAGTVSVRYRVTGGLASARLTVTVNGQTVANGIYGDTEWANHAISCSASDTITVTALYRKDNFQEQYDDNAYVSLTGTVPFTVTSNIGKLSYEEGTGAIGGWEKSQMRAYLNDTIRLAIPEDVRIRIQTVDKKQQYFGTEINGLYLDQTTEDKVWIPSHNEVIGSTAYELFINDSSLLVKSKPNGSTDDWWLRSVSGNNVYHAISDDNGRYYTAPPDMKKGVVICFCT